MRITQALLILASVSAAAPAAAQQHAHPAQEHPMTAMHCGGMPAMMMEMMGPPAPAMILHHKDELKLTAAQISRLETLQKEAEPACRQHMHLAMEAHMAANQLLDQASPDYATFAAKLNEAAGHMVQGHVFMAKAAVTARGTLSAEQQQALKSLMQRMHQQK